MESEKCYEKRIQQVTVQGKSVIIENRIPVDAEREREKRKAEINRTLYEVFSKYQ